jgi:hypothetical protein
VRRNWFIAIAVVAGLVLAGGVAYASIPDAAGVIHGCYQKVNGQLRVIDTSRGGTCSPSENALSWNQTGPTGAQGPTGPTGAKGATGATGPTGAAGSATAFADLEANGVVVASKNLTSHSASGSGQYELIFSPSLRACAVGASAITATGPSILGGAPPGLAFAQHEPGPGVIRVETTNLSGALTPHAFEVTAVC